jgi:type IV pilus assembly protein PilV
MDSKKFINRKASGFTLLEVVVALVIFTLGMLGVAAMQLRATYGNASGQRLTEATRQAEFTIESLLMEPYPAVIPAVPVVNTVGQYTVTTSYANVASFAATEAQLVTINVAWNEPGIPGRNVVMNFIKSQGMDGSYVP